MVPDLDTLLIPLYVELTDRIIAGLGMIEEILANADIAQLSVAAGQ